MILQHFDKYNLFDKYKGDVSEAIRCLELFFDKETKYIERETDSLLGSLNNLKYDESYIIDLKLDNSWKQAIDYVSKIDFVDYVKDRIYEEYEHKYERTFEEDHSEEDRWFKEAIERMRKEKEKERERLEELQETVTEEETQNEEGQLEGIDPNLPEAIDDAAQREAEQAAIDAEAEAERARQEAERTRTQQAAEAAERARQEAEAARARQEAEQATADETARRLQEATRGRVEDPGQVLSSGTLQDVGDLINIAKQDGYYRVNPDGTLVIENPNGEDFELDRVGDFTYKSVGSNGEEIIVYVEEERIRTRWPSVTSATGRVKIDSIEVNGTNGSSTITKNNDGSVTTTETTTYGNITTEQTRTDKTNGQIDTTTTTSVNGVPKTTTTYVKQAGTNFEQSTSTDLATGTKTVTSSDPSMGETTKVYNSEGKMTEYSHVYENPLTHEKDKQKDLYDPETGENIYHETEHTDTDGKTVKTVEDIRGDTEYTYKMNRDENGLHETWSDTNGDTVKRDTDDNGNYTEQTYDRDGNPVGDPRTGNNSTGGSGESSDSGGDSSGE